MDIPDCARSRCGLCYACSLEWWCTGKEHLLASRRSNDPWDDISFQWHYPGSNSNRAQYWCDAERQSAGADCGYLGLQYSHNTFTRILHYASTDSCRIPALGDDINNHRRCRDCSCCNLLARKEILEEMSVSSAI